jgi:hypothetical protein
MPYVTCSHVPGHGLDDYRTIAAAMGPDAPAGRLALIVGEADGALHIVDVWASRADADRFAAERLFPAFVRTGLGPGTDSSHVGFDTDDVSLEVAR